jgi:hypothetical protein
MRRADSETGWYNNPAERDTTGMTASLGICNLRIRKKGGGGGEERTLAMAEHLSRRFSVTLLTGPDFDADRRWIFWTKTPRCAGNSPRKGRTFGWIHLSEEAHIARYLGLIRELRPSDLIRW